MASMTDQDRVFLDTSVLVQGLIDLGRSSRAAMSILDAVASGDLEKPWTAWHCCLEFFSVSTRLPGEFRLHPIEAQRLLQEEILCRLKIAELPSSSRKQLFDTAAEEKLRGGRIYDLHIGEIARTVRTTVLVTDNRRHFSPLLGHRIRVLTASQFAKEWQFE